MRRSPIRIGLLPLFFVFTLAGACGDDTTADPDATDAGTDVVEDTAEGDADITSDADPSDVADDAVDDTADDAVGEDAGGDVAPDADPPNLRPNVQADMPPNAEGQTPESPDQTRAPQPEEAAAFSATVRADGLEIPWGIAPLPDGRLLVTERIGRLRVVAVDGTVGEPVEGLPDLVQDGQGGLLDVAISPDFATDATVFITYSEARENDRLAVAVARGTLSDDGRRLEDVGVIYQQEPSWPGGRHFGSRLVFDRDGALFVTFGDRGSALDDAQSPFNAIGAVIRIWPDGTIPDDNPFADGVDGAPEVWSWGHRNIQSATLGLDGALWTVEHGAQGGDELNRPEPGANHGWPLITYGENYDGTPIRGGVTAQEGLAQPVYYWDPVIAPSGMATYTGDLFDGWQGDLLIGGLQSTSVVRLSLREGRVYTEEWLPMGVRVRSVAVARDGAILVGTDAGQIVELRPE